MDEKPDEVLTAEEVAKFLKIHVRTIYVLAKAGKIPHGKIGSSLRFKRSDIEKMLESSE